MAAATTAARQVSADAVSNPSKLKSAVDTVLTRIVPGGMAIGAAGAVTVNRPDLVANLAEVIAVSLSNITDIAVTSTWSDWGQAILGIGRAIGVISRTGALQSFQGPVVPFAIATAIMTWRAQNAGKSIFKQIKDDASAASAVATSAASATMKAMRPDPMEALFELADRARQIKVAGAGAEDLRELVIRDLRGVPAARGGPAGVTQVPASAPRDPGMPLKRIAGLVAPPGMGALTAEAHREVAREARERRALAAPGSAAPEDAVMAPPPLPAGPKPGDKRGREDDGAGVFPPGAKKTRSLGGRRKTQKRKSKRRVTRRAAPTAVKFVY